MSKKKFNISLVLFFCIIAIFIGKTIRYTVMKETLVTPGIGWHMLEKVNNNLYDFKFTITNSESDEEVGTATSNAGFLFALLNIAHIFNTYYGYEILISIVWNIIILIMISNLKKTYNFVETIFIFSSVVVLNIFDFCLAKEPIQMLSFIFMYLILKSSKSYNFKYVGCLVVFLLSTVTYRNYYILMIGFMIYISFLYKFLVTKTNKLKIKHILFILISILVCYYIFLLVARFIDIKSFNELLRVRLRSSSAKSDMRAIFRSSNLFIFSIDYLIMLLRMMIPIELIKLGPKYAIYAIYQIMISMIVSKNLINISKINNSQRISIYIYIAFLMGSAAFEPDFGSWIRHEAAIFPILLIMLNNMNEKVIRNDEIYVKNN